jgi:putative addiction module component (TIGR02574 family)
MLASFNAQGVITMNNQLEQLHAQAAQLSVNERAMFAQMLLASLDEDTDVDAAWATETEARMNALEQGLVKALPLADALLQVRARLT